MKHLSITIFFVAFTLSVSAQTILNGVRLSDLNNKSSISGSEKIPVSGGGNPSITPSLIKTFVNTSPALTGTPTAPTATEGTNTTQVATTAFVQQEIDEVDSDLVLKANIASPTLTGTPAAPTATTGTNTTQLATTAFVQQEITANSSITYGLVCSNLSDALTVGTTKSFLVVPAGFTVDAVYAYLLTAQSSGSILTIDINEGGTSILSTRLTIDNSETGSNTATTAAVISDSSIAAHGRITVDIDQVGTGGVGLLVWIVGH